MEYPSSGPAGRTTVAPHGYSNSAFSAYSRQYRVNKSRRCVIELILDAEICSHSCSVRWKVAPAGIILSVPQGRPLLGLEYQSESYRYASG